MAMSPQEQAMQEVQSEHGNWFTKNFDPLTLGLVMLANGGRPAEEAIGMGLLQGRQARLDEATRRAEAAAAKRKEQSDVAKFQTDAQLKYQKEGFSPIKFDNTGYGLAEAPVRDPTAPVDMGDVGTNPPLFIKRNKDGSVNYAQALTSKGGRKMFVDLQGKEVDPAGYEQSLSPDLVRDISRSRNYGGTAGSAEANAQASAGSERAALEQTKVLAQSFMDHPGKEGFIGSLGAGGWLPFSETAQAGAIYDELVGKGGIAAFQMVKGAGPVTEKETAMAEAALGRIKNLRQGTKAWEVALDDYLYALELGVQKIENQASGQSFTSKKPPREDPLGILR